MRNKKVRKTMLKPRLVTAITAGFMVAATSVACFAIIGNSRNAGNIGQDNVVNEDLRAQIVERNMEIR